MTRLLEKAIEAARMLSPEEQDELAMMILAAVEGGAEDAYVLSDEERAAIDVALEQMDRGEYASEEEVAALFSRHGL